MGNKIGRIGLSIPSDVTTYMGFPGRATSNLLPNKSHGGLPHFSHKYPRLQSGLFQQVDLSLGQNSGLFQGLQVYA